MQKAPLYAARAYLVLFTTERGAQTQSERHGYREISIFKDGVVL